MKTSKYYSNLLLPIIVFYIAYLMLYIQSCIQTFPPPTGPSFGDIDFTPTMYMLWFIFLVLRKLRDDFKGNLTLYNFCLILGFFILIGLAHFSGALLKRPNSSIYFAFILALLRYQTVLKPKNLAEDQ